LYIHREEMRTVLPNKRYSEDRKVTEKEEDRRTEKNCGEKYADSMLQTQLEEDEGGSTGQSWMDGRRLWPMFHRE